MVYPTRDFAETYGSLRFCDDVTETYSMPLADSESLSALGNYLFFPRLLRKLFRMKKPNAHELFWPYGVIAFRPAILRPWYRFNVLLWDSVRAMRQKKTKR